MNRIRDLESKIRDFINDPRRQEGLLENSAHWNKLCSSLDVIGDTNLAISAYMEKLGEPVEHGENYILLYGILQILFVQQDAVKHIDEALGFDFSSCPDLKAIREIRNASIGHPTKHSSGDGSASSFIRRVDMSRSGYSLMTTYPDRDHDIRYIDLPSLIKMQTKIIEELLNAVVERLKADEMAHRKEFREDKLVDVFPPTIGYYFEKISETIHDSKPFEFGLIHIELISEIVSDFKKKLSDRGLYSAMDAVKYHVELIEYPINQLRIFFQESEEFRLNAQDAHIFLSFIRQQSDLLKQLATEIDDNYAQDP